MDWLFRIFYTVLSLGIVVIFLAPVVLLVRLVLQRAERRCAVWEWRIVFLRCLCPVALSSPFCLVPRWNRQFHSLLNQMGLTVEGGGGIMRSWREIFLKEISTTLTFRACSIIWLAGMLLLLLWMTLTQRRVRLTLAKAKFLGEGFYESGYLRAPLQTGIVHRKIYVPRGMSAQEIAWLLRRMNCRRYDGLRYAIVGFVAAVYWFCPVVWLYVYLWRRDWQIACDEKTIYHRPKAEVNRYAQALLNFEKTEKKGLPLSMLTVSESRTEARARRLMYQSWDKKNTKWLQALLLLLFLALLFLLTPLHKIWGGQTTGEDDNQTVSEALFGDRQNQVIAQAQTTSPEGLDRVIQLEMTSGQQTEDGYEGAFQLAMYDTTGNLLVSNKVSEYFEDGSTAHFSNNVTLCIQDYNGDGTQELVLGQEQELSQSEFETLVSDIDSSADSSFSKKLKDVGDYQIFLYCLIPVKNKKLDSDGSTVYSITTSKKQKESKNFEVPEDSEKLFAVSMGEQTLYYIWNDTSQKYQPQYMTKKELQEYNENGTLSEEAGETQEHTLKDSDGEIQVLVSTKTDTTGSEAIQSVTLSPRNKDRKYENISGYYCDLYWTPTEDTDTERYALLIYNGTKAQTFLIYDTQNRNIYYQHEDGVEILKSLFEQVGEDSITFADDAVAVYSVTQKKEDELTISFAVQDESGVSYKGSYVYNVKNKTGASLSFSRSTDSTDSTDSTE